jgi:hypothetical protein
MQIAGRAVGCWMVLAGITGGLAACSSSTSPAPTPSGDGGVADGGVPDGATPDAGVEGGAPTAACVDVSATCLENLVESGFCGVTGTKCSDGKKHQASCDATGLCVCSVDGVPTCTCQAPDAGFGCSSDSCCYGGSGVVPPGP